MRKKTVHFSVDDTIWLFNDLNSNNYKSAFEQPVLNFFQGLHQRYGLMVSFYCFMRQDWFELSNVTDAYRQEFSDNSFWCRFGFHAYDEQRRYAEVECKLAAADYAGVMEQLDRIVGGALDYWPRIHCYSANREALTAWQKQGLCGVLCPERAEIKVYDLDCKQRQQVNTKGVYLDKSTGLGFLATDIRIEETNCMAEVLLAKQHRPHLEIFTHEWALDRDNVKEKIEICCSMLERIGYQGGFYESGR